MLFAYDCIFILSSFISMFLLGLPFVALIPSDKFKNKYLISTLFGYGLVAFLGTVTYKFGITHKHLAIFLWISIFLICITSIFNSNTKILLTNNSKKIVYFLAFWLLAVTIIFLPYWTGGPIFSFAQGWVHDHFSYLGSSLTYNHEKFSEVLQSSGEFFLRAPVALYGAIDLYRRPGVDHLFGVLSQIRAQEMYRTGYLLLAFLAANGMLAATFFITNVFKNSSLMRALLISVAIFLGFWGQTYIDFDAWSMSSALPILIATTCYVIVMARAADISIIRFNELIPLSCLYGFALYLYPEITFFHLPVFMSILGFMLWQGYRAKSTKISLYPILKIFAALILGLCLSVFYYQGTLGFFWWAITFAAENKMTAAVYGDYLQPMFGQADWFRPLLNQGVVYSNSFGADENQHKVLGYILRYIVNHGHLEIIYYTFVDGFYGLFGMYFLTPHAAFSVIIQQCWRALLALAMIGFFWLNWKSYKQILSKNKLFAIIPIIFALVLITFLVSTRVFAMARGFFYVAPYFIFLFCLPLLYSEKIFSLKNYLIILFIFSQIGFGITRVGLAAYQSPFLPYPYSFAVTHYFPQGKTQYDWNISRFDKKLKQCHRVYIDVANGWQEYYVTFYLYAKNKKFVKSMPVKTSFWAAPPNVIGYQPLNGHEDCTFIATKKILADGKEFNELDLVRNIDKKKI